MICNGPLCTSIRGHRDVHALSYSGPTSLLCCQLSIFSLSVRKMSIYSGELLVDFYALYEGKLVLTRLLDQKWPLNM